MVESDRVIDQASGLRRQAQSQPVRTIAITGGKGGIGKTNIAINLAFAFSRMNRDVMLMDADLGLANIDVLLGLNTLYDLSHVITGEQTLDNILVDGPGGIKIVPGASGVSDMADLSSAQHASLIRAFGELTQPLDILIVDTAAGISNSVISFTKACQDIVVTICDEPTSITDAYALIKLLSQQHGIRRFHIVANMVRNRAHGEELFHRICRVTDRFLDVALELIGSVPFDGYLRRAVRQQALVVDAYPSSEAAKALTQLAEHIAKWPRPRDASGYLEFFVERLVDLRGDNAMQAELA